MLILYLLIATVANEFVSCQYAQIPPNAYRIGGFPDFGNSYQQGMNNQGGSSGNSNGQLADNQRDLVKIFGTPGGRYVILRPTTSVGGSLSGTNRITATIIKSNSTKTGSAYNVKTIPDSYYLNRTKGATADNGGTVSVSVSEQGAGNSVTYNCRTCWKCVKTAKTVVGQSSNVYEQIQVILGGIGQAPGQPQQPSNQQNCCCNNPVNPGMPPLPEDKGYATPSAEQTSTPGTQPTTTASTTATTTTVVTPTTTIPSTTTTQPTTSTVPCTTRPNPPTQPCLQTTPSSPYFPPCSPPTMPPVVPPCSQQQEYVTPRGQTTTVWTKPTEIVTTQTTPTDTPTQSTHITTTPQEIITTTPATVTITSTTPQITSKTKPGIPETTATTPRFTVPSDNSYPTPPSYPGNSCCYVDLHIQSATLKCNCCPTRPVAELIPFPGGSHTKRITCYQAVQLGILSQDHLSSLTQCFPQPLVIPLPGYPRANPNFPGGNNGFPGDNSNRPAGNNGFPGGSNFPGGNQNVPGTNYGYRTGNQIPGNNPNTHGGYPNTPRGNPNFPGGNPNFPGGNPNFPGGNPGGNSGYNTGNSNVPQGSSNVPGGNNNNNGGNANFPGSNPNFPGGNAYGTGNQNIPRGNPNTPGGTNSPGGNPNTSGGGPTNSGGNPNSPGDHPATYVARPSSFPPAISPPPESVPTPNKPVYAVPAAPGSNPTAPITSSPDTSVNEDATYATGGGAETAASKKSAVGSSVLTSVAVLIFGFVFSC